MFEKHLVTSLTNDILENKIDGNFSYQLNNSRITFKKLPHIHPAAVSMTTCRLLNIWIRIMRSQWI